MANGLPEYQASVAAPGVSSYRAEGSMWPGLAQAVGQLGRTAEIMAEVEQRTSALEDQAIIGQALNEYRAQAAATLSDPSWHGMAPREAAEGQKSALKDLTDKFTGHLNEKVRTPQLKQNAQTQLGNWNTTFGIQAQEAAQKNAVTWAVSQGEVDREKRRAQAISLPRGSVERDAIIAEQIRSHEELVRVGAWTPGQAEAQSLKFQEQVKHDGYRREIETSDKPKEIYKAMLLEDDQFPPEKRMPDQVRRDLFNWANAVENARHSEAVRADYLKQKEERERSEINLNTIQAEMVKNRANPGAMKALRLQIESLPESELIQAHKSRLLQTADNLEGIVQGKDDQNILKQADALASTHFDQDGQTVDRRSYVAQLESWRDQGLLTPGSVAQLTAKYDSVAPPAWSANDKAAVADLKRNVDQFQLDPNRLNPNEKETPHVVMANIWADAQQIYAADRTARPNDAPELASDRTLQTLRVKYAPKLFVPSAESIQRDFPGLSLDPDRPLTPQIGEALRAGKIPADQVPKALGYAKHEAVERERLRQKQVGEAGKTAQERAAESGPSLLEKAYESLRQTIGLAPQTLKPEGVVSLTRQIQEAQVRLDRLKSIQASPFDFEPGLTPGLVAAAERNLSELRSRLPVPQPQAERMAYLYDKLYSPDAKKAEPDQTRRQLYQAEWNALAVQYGPRLGISVPAPATAPGTAPTPGNTPGGTATRLISANSPARVLSAIANYESNNNPNAEGKSGEIGKYQMMPETARAMGYDPEQLRVDESLQDQAAKTHLATLRSIFKNDDEKVIAAWNAGPDAVQRAVQQAGPSGDWRQFLPRGINAKGVKYNTTKYLTGVLSVLNTIGSTTSAKGTGD